MVKLTETEEEWLMSHQDKDLCSASHLISFREKEALIDAVLTPSRDGACVFL